MKLGSSCMQTRQCEANLNHQAIVCLLKPLDPQELRKGQVACTVAWSVEWPASACCMEILHGCDHEQLRNNTLY